MLAGCDAKEDIQHGETETADGGTETAEGAEGDDHDEDTFPARVADAYCAALFACDPANTCWSPDPVPYASEAECVETERGLVQEAQTAARGESLIYDAECVESIIEDFTELGCDGSIGVRLRRTEAFQCTPYHGSVPRHENPCFEVVGSNFSDCGRNLFCDGEDMTCDPFSPPECTCEDGFDCVIGTPEAYSCHPIAQIGETCGELGVTVAACTLDAFCAQQFVDGELVGATCVPRGELGEPCMTPTECLSFNCGDEVCIPESPLLCGDGYAPRQWR